MKDGVRSTSSSLGHHDVASGMNGILHMVFLDPRNCLLVRPTDGLNVGLHVSRWLRRYLVASTSNVQRVQMVVRVERSLSLGPAQPATVGSCRLPIGAGTLSGLLSCSMLCSDVLTSQFQTVQAAAAAQRETPPNLPHTPVRIPSQVAPSPVASRLSLGRPPSMACRHLQSCPASAAVPCPGPTANSQRTIKIFACRSPPLQLLSHELSSASLPTIAHPTNCVGLVVA